MVAFRAVRSAFLILMLAVLPILLLVVIARDAAGQTEPPLQAPAEPASRERATEVLARAERDDAALGLGRAADQYEEALRIDPSMPKAILAAERAKMIRKRSEGHNFAPLIALERVRRDAALASNAKAIDELVAASLDPAFPPGLVRVETWMFAAEAYANRLGRPNDAAPLWQRIVDDRHADSILINSALRSLTSHYLARGEYAKAEAAIDRVPIVDAQLAASVRRALRRRSMHNASIGIVGALIFLAATSLAMAVKTGRGRVVLERARGSARLVIAYAAYVALSGALLAMGYEQGTSSRPFLLFGIALVPLLFLARAWAAAGSPTRWARTGRATLCATGALGVAFLVLEHVDVAYLEGIGL